MSSSVPNLGNIEKGVHVLYREFNHGCWKRGVVGWPLSKDPSKNNQVFASVVPEEYLCADDPKKEANYIDIFKRDWKRRLRLLDERDSSDGSGTITTTTTENISSRKRRVNSKGNDIEVEDGDDVSLLSVKRSIFKEKEGKIVSIQNSVKSKSTRGLDEKMLVPERKNRTSKIQEEIVRKDSMIESQKLAIRDLRKTLEKFRRNLAEKDLEISNKDRKISDLFTRVARMEEDRGKEHMKLKKMSTFSEEPLKECVTDDENLMIPLGYYDHDGDGEQEEIPFPFDDFENREAFLHRDIVANVKEWAEDELIVTQNNLHVGRIQNFFNDNSISQQLNRVIKEEPLDTHERVSHPTDPSHSSQIFHHSKVSVSTLISNSKNKK